VYVRPLKTIYKPETGDIVIGRVVNVESKRWMVDINSYQTAILNLTATFLLGGE
jgi:exosome complex component RRP4